MKHKLGALIVVALLIAAVTWYSRREDAIALTLATVGRGTVELTVSNTRAGTVKACRRSGLSMTTGGRVERLHVREGQEVATGELLLELWNDDRAALAKQSESQLAAAGHRREQACVEAENASREARRLRTLLERRLASQELTEAAQTRAQAAVFACRAAQDEQETAVAALELNRALLAQTQLRAPFAGIIAKIEAEPGEFVTPSPPGIPTLPAVDLIDYSCLYVTAPIDEVDAGSLRVGLPARISLDAFRGEHFAGHLDRVAPYVVELEKQARTVEVDVRLDAASDRERLLVGYSADVDIVLDSREAVLRIPSESLLEGDQVYRLDPGEQRVHRVDVGVGIRNWNWTEVTSGLTEGDRIVVSLDTKGLADGARVVEAAVEP